MRYSILITARLKSTRFKKKIIKKFFSQETVIDHLINRLKKNFPSKNIILITSRSNQDKELINISLKHNINYFRGDPRDVLKRMFDACKKFKIKNFISCTADNPLIDHYYAKKLIEHHIKNKNSLTTMFDLPIGLYTYAIQFNALKKVINKKNSKNTEIWINFFKELKSLKIEDVKVKKAQKLTKKIRVTIDYSEDFKFVNEILKKSKRKYPLLHDITNVINKYPNLSKINLNKKQKKPKKARMKNEK